jgi:hypothetical protein
MRDVLFAVYAFEGCHDRPPEMLETIAGWLRDCAEYLLEQVARHTIDGWSTVSVVVHELRPGDLMQQLESQGHPDLAASLAASVTEHRTREGLRPNRRLVPMSAVRLSRRPRLTILRHCWIVPTVFGLQP